MRRFGAIYEWMKLATNSSELPSSSVDYAASAIASRNLISCILAMSTLGVAMKRTSDIIIMLIMVFLKTSKSQC